MDPVEDTTPPLVPEKYRAYFYRLASAVALVAGGYGLIEDNKAALILVLVSAVLGLPLAAANTSTKEV